MFQLKTKKVIYILIAIVLLLLLYALKNTSYFIRVFGFIFFVFVFIIADKFFELGFKKIHYLIFILIAITGILLSPLYFLYPNYDKALHLIDPFLIGILVFFLVNKLKIKFTTKLLLTFSIIIMFLSLFEILEYVLDQILGMKLQGVFIRDYSGIEKLKIIQDRNDDTMIDLIIGVIGSLLFIGVKTIEHNYKRLKKKFKL
tara:strand:+ start:2906 stop:3508 length:603 start_codon:yes stop_codon:yes gene_type:complete